MRRQILRRIRSLLGLGLERRCEFRLNRLGDRFLDRSLVRRSLLLCGLRTVDCGLLGGVNGLRLNLSRLRTEVKSVFASRVGVRQSLNAWWKLSIQPLC